MVLSICNLVPIYILITYIHTHRHLTMHILHILKDGKIDKCMHFGVSLTDSE